MDIYAMPGLGGPTPPQDHDGRDPAVISWQAAFDGQAGTDVPLSRRGLPALGTE